MKHIIFIFMLAFLVSSNLFSQGLNNNYPLDSIDLKHLFEVNKMSVFKFPLEQKKENGNLKIILESYRKNKLISSDNITKHIQKDLLDLSLQPQTIRVYCRVLDDNQTVKFVFYIENYSLECAVDFFETQDYQSNTFSMINAPGQNEDYTIGLEFSRAYTLFQPQKNQSIPALVWYGDAVGKSGMLGCPGGHTEAEITSIYDFVIFVKFEIE